ncbi:MAG: peptidoglycan recognition family protein [Planctomycetota bacterium]
MRIPLVLSFGFVLFLSGCASNVSSVTDESALRVIDRTQPGRTYAQAGPSTAVKPVASFGISMYPRSAWAAGLRQPTKMTPMGKITRVTIHHEGRDEANNMTAQKDVIVRLRATCMSHRNYRGWSDIGYHFAIDRAGRIWECRSLAYQGAHADGANGGNIGIEVLGNFDVQSPTAAQKQALETLVQKLCARYDVPLGRIYTHRELCNTECPGRNLQAYVNQMRRELRATASR